MKLKLKLVIIISGFVIGALSNWTFAYNEINLIENKVLWWIVIGGCLISSGFYIQFSKIKPFRISVLLWIGVIVAITFRAIYDILIIDPTSHNLIPFEIIFYSILAIPSGLAGAYLVSLTKILLRIT